MSLPGRKPIRTLTSIHIFSNYEKVKIAVDFNSSITEKVSVADVGISFWYFINVTVNSTTIQTQTQTRKIYSGGVIYFGYGIKFSNLELRIGQKATYKVGLDLDSDFDPNYGSKASRQRGYQAFENEEE